MHTRPSSHRPVPFRALALFAVVGLLPACNGDAGTSSSPTNASSSKGVSSVPGSGARPSDAVAKGPDTPAPEDDDSVPEAKFEGGEKNFRKLKEALLERYYRDGITEDDLWRAAVRGMLTYADPPMKKWNALLSPEEVRELRVDLKGEVVGIGVHIRFDDASGHSEVLGVIPGSPAEKAGIAQGDRIVSVGGKIGRGRTLRDVVGDIRGKAGEKVSLVVLRDDKLLPFSVERGTVPFEAVDHSLLEGKIGYLRIKAFSAKTPPAVRRALETFAKDGATSFVVDLRSNHGGGFDDAVSTAELMVPEGATIVRVVGRDGKDERIVSKGKPVLPLGKTVVLVDSETSSGGEFVAAALAEDVKATLVGARTLGKWSVQTIDDLPNGYAAKFTTHLFQSPGGRAFQGVGMAPDIETAMDPKSLERLEGMRDAKERLAADVQLRTAVRLLAESKP